jgi:hypothetical protein
MYSLENKNISFILISSHNNLSGISSYLYSQGYTILPIKEYYRGTLNDSIIAYHQRPDNNVMRGDIIRIIDSFGGESIITKYFGEEEIKKVESTGNEIGMELLLYNTDSLKKSYIHNGISFSFQEKMTYKYPKSESDFKRGMIVEYLSGDEWKERVVSNPELEFKKMYSLLIKYNKIRIPNKLESHFI